MATYVPPKKNTAFIFYVSLVSQANTKVLQGSPTIAAGDFKVSIDGGALNNLATLPVVTPAASKMVKIELSAAEMNGDNIMVVASDAAGAEWCDAAWLLQTSARQVDDLTFPTVSGRSLDVSATGEAGVDWANVGSPTTVVGLSGTTVKTATDVETDTADIQTRLPAALVGARMDSNASAISGVAATADRLEAWLNGFITGAAAGVPTASVIPTDLTEATDDHFNHMIMAFTGGVLLGQARRISDYNGTTKEATVQPPYTEAPTAGDTFIIVTIIVGGLDANGRMDLGSVLGSAINALIAGRVDANAQVVGTAAISSGSFSAGALDAAAHAADFIGASELSAAAAEKIADAILARNVAGGSNTGRLVKEALYVLRNRVAIAGGTLTAYGTDDATPAFTAAVTTTAGNPISEIDPA